MNIYSAWLVVSFLQPFKVENPLTPLSDHLHIPNNMSGGRPITICTHPDNCTVCKSIFSIGMTPHFSMGHPIDGIGRWAIKMVATNFWSFPFISWKQKTSHIISFQQDYFPNPMLSNWIFNKLFQGGQNFVISVFVVGERWTRCRRARL